MIRPLMICSTGRSGSTLLMNLLRTSKEIACPGGYPFEDRYLALFQLIAHVFQHPQPATLINARELKELIPSRLLALLQFPAKFNTAPEYIEPEHFIGSMVTDLWRTFVENITKHHADSGRLKYYAEKAVGPSLFPQSHLLAPKVIHLIRDPRDFVISVREFNKKRGFFGFAWDAADDDFTYATKMMPMFRGIMQEAAKYFDGKNGETITLRYEDLIGNLDGESSKLESWLGVGLAPAEIRSQRFEPHITSAGPEQSVERWREEMEGRLIELFDRELGAQLRLCGYPLAG